MKRTLTFTKGLTWRVQPSGQAFSAQETLKKQGSPSVAAELVSFEFSCRELRMLCNCANMISARAHRDQNG
jgi:hypothetical protein